MQSLRYLSLLHNVNIANFHSFPRSTNSRFSHISNIIKVQTFNYCTSRPDVCYSLVVQTPIDIMSRDKPNALMTHEACESKLRLVVRSSMHPYPGKWVAIGHVVVHYAWAAREFSAGIKCRHCTLAFQTWLTDYRNEIQSNVNVLFPSV